MRSWIGSGLQNKVPQAGRLKQQKFTLAPLEAGSLRSKSPRVSFCVCTLPGCSPLPSHCVLTWQRGGALVHLLLVRATALLDQSPILLTSFNLEYLTGFISKYSHSGGLGLPHNDLDGELYSP